jgi:hypothetical protein
MSRKIVLDAPSLLVGALVGASTTASVLTMASSLSALARAATAAAADLVPGPVGLATAAVLAVAGIAAAADRRAGGTAWTLDPGGRADFVARMRAIFPFLPPGDCDGEVLGALGASEWMDRALGDGPWSHDGVYSVLRGQLGEPLDADVAAAPLHVRAAAALFALAALRDPRHDAIRDLAARAFWEGDAGAAARLEGEVRGMVAEPRVSGLLDKAAARHGYRSTWLMGLRAAALEARHGSAAEWAWLKRVDRPLFYAVNACGRPSHLLEAAAQADHYAAERRAEKALRIPAIDGAVAALTRELGREAALRADA